MPHITLGASQLTCPSETLLLDSLLQANLRIPYSCRQGICQSCLMQSMDAKPPALAQVGLKDTLQRQNYFLACRCYPEQDMHITLPNQHGQSINAVVTEKRRLAPDIMQLTVQANGLNFYAGQFINLQRADGLTRSYSIANPPSPDNTLEFHIRRLPHGQFSNWVHDGLAIGDPLTLSQAQGSCYYLPDNPAQPLLLIGTGSGLAPLYGIIHDALAQGHSGDIHLYHGSRDPDGLYLTEELHTLAANVAHFHYTPCLSGEPQASGYAQGRAHELALADKKNLKGWRVYLCGHPEMVNNSQRMAYIKGASLKDIYSDAFVVQQAG